MSDGLTARQTQMLKALIDEYIETAEAVGSERLDKKYNLEVSSATIRNEMATLTKKGYLRQPHTSAGRIPSPKAMKFYVNQLMEEKQMSLTDEVKAKEEVWDSRKNLDKLLEQATHVLAERTNSLAVATMEDGEVWHSGYANVFNNPEFADLRFCASVFSLLEESERLQQAIWGNIEWSSPVELIFGEDLGWPGLSSLGIATTQFNIHGKNGALAIIGPARLQFSTIIPILRYFGNLMNEVSSA